jgi:hypothetical protein
LATLAVAATGEIASPAAINPRFTETRDEWRVALRHRRWHRGKQLWPGACENPRGFSDSRSGIVQRFPIAIWKLFLPLALAGAHPADGALPHGNDAAATICADRIQAAEQRFGIPAQLLSAISLVESGRYSKEHKASFAWPWTVNAEGKGYFLPSKAEAIATVRELQGRGVRSIDVGCMQINLYHHPDAFDTLEQAFDPGANVAYAAAFLLTLFEDTGSWRAAAGRYHSANPDHGEPYLARVIGVWNREKQGGPADSGATPARPARAVAATAEQPRRFVIAPVDHERMARLKAALLERREALASPAAVVHAATTPAARDTGAEAAFTERRMQQLRAWRDLVQRLKSASSVTAMR